MSFIQLKLGGELRGLKFNMGAIQAFWTTIDLANSVATEKYAIVYAGLCGNKVAKKSDDILSYDEVREWVDELASTREGYQKLKEACIMFQETEHYKISYEEFQDNIRTWAKAQSGDTIEKKSLAIAV